MHAEKTTFNRSLSKFWLRQYGRGTVSVPFQLPAARLFPCAML
jgi:hypothetical protein